MDLHSSHLRSTRWWRRLAYGAIALLLTLGLSVGQAPIASALSWLDILRGGVRVFQGVQLSNMSERQEMDLGKQINDELTKKEFKLYTEPTINAYVNRIGQRVIQQSQRSTLTYTFQVVDDKQVNAFATLGGYVYLTTGLLRTAENEAEVAGVLGHEAGHIEGKHLIAQMSRAALQQGLMTAAGLDRNRAVQLGVELGVRRPRSRDNEFDADNRGLRMMGAVGYAQNAMVSFMEKLLKVGGQVPTFLSTHPATQDRIRELQKRVDATKVTGDGLDTNGYRQQIQPLLAATPR